MNVKNLMENIAGAKRQQQTFGGILEEINASNNLKLWNFNFSKKVTLSCGTALGDVLVDLFEDLYRQAVDRQKEDERILNAANDLVLKLSKGSEED